MSKLRVVETDELESSVYLFQNTKHNIDRDGAKFKNVNKQLSF